MEESVDEAVLELDMPDLATWTEPRTPNLAFSYVCSSHDVSQAVVIYLQFSLSVVLFCL